jgi:adenylate cyclase
VHQPEPHPSSKGPHAHEDFWRSILLGTNPEYSRNRRTFKRIPGSPRCKMCAVPFGGVAAPLMRAMGHSRWPKNPNYCVRCFNVLNTLHGGAEIECTLLFADVRGSTTLAEGMSASQYQQLMSRFYGVAGRVLVAHDAIVDKFVGDEVVAIFIPALARDRHAEQAIAAARALLIATGNVADREPWLLIGAGVHSGLAYVGSVGQGAETELTALGDVVNVAARLASAAGAGELLVSDSAEAAAGISGGDEERRSLKLRGKSTSVDVVVFHA